jgi:hypothetical protein
MSPRNNSRESGFALILALLALALLTTMGLALANSSSVELQIATNQRWSESARFNAEAGLEYAKKLLVAAPDWSVLLPPARVASPWGPTAWTGTSPNPTAPFTNATRNFESFRCDQRGYGMGYGVVYDDGTSGGLLEYKSDIGGAALNGAYTIWIRRPVMWSGGSGTGTTLQDYPSDDVVMVLAEGVAPYTGAGQNTGAVGVANRSVFMIEALLTRKGAPVLDQSQCNTRQGQAGGSSSGGNTAGCVALTAGRQVTEALTGQQGVGTGVLK